MLPHRSLSPFHQPIASAFGLCSAVPSGGICLRIYFGHVAPSLRRHLASHPRQGAVTPAPWRTPLGKSHKGSQHIAPAIPPVSPPLHAQPRTSIPPPACKKILPRTASISSQHLWTQVPPFLLQLSAPYAVVGININHLFRKRRAFSMSGTQTGEFSCFWERSCPAPKRLQISNR
jgi:hypothetical protein